MSFSYRHLLSMTTLAGALVNQSGCASDDSVQGNIVATNNTTQSLTSGDLDSVNGTYGAGCRNRSSGNWSVAIAGGAELDNAPLTVVLKNTACVLTVTELHTEAGVVLANPAIELSTSYQADPSAFGDPLTVFYANARLTSVSFAGDFVIEMIYSDDPSLATGNNTAQFEVVESTATAESIPAPDYALDVATLGVLTDIDDVVVSVSGTAGLSEGSGTGQTGETYVVVNATGLTTYAAIDAAYTGATGAAIDTTVPADDFALVGDDLTVSKVRTLIIAHTVDGVRSYQRFQVTFHKAV